MIVRYFVQDPLYDTSSGDDYLLIFHVPEKSRNEKAFVHMLETLKLDYIREESVRKPRAKPEPIFLSEEDKTKMRELMLATNPVAPMGRATLLSSNPETD